MPPNGSSKYLQPAALVVPEIKELLAHKDYVTLKQCLREFHPVDLADRWDAFEPEQQVQLFQLLGTVAAVTLFESLSPEDQRFLLMTLGDESAPVIEGLAPENVARLFHRLPKKVVKKLAGLVKREESLQKIQLLMTFPRGSAGSLMHPEFIKLTPTMTAKQALEILQAVARPHHGSHIYALYVTNGQGKLQGTLTLQELIGAPSDARLSELASSVEAIKIPAQMDQEEVARRFAKYDLVSAPVVNEEGALIGVLTVDDIIDVMRQEASEDIAKMAGTKAEEFQAQNIFRIARLRLPWLIASIGGGFLVSLVIKHFEGTLLRVVALASFMPLIAAMGGNVGAQSATIVVRSLAIGHLRPQDWRKAMIHELGVGGVLGVSYALMVGVFAYLLYGGTLGSSFALVVSLGMLTSMIVAAMIGAVEPFFFQRLGIDPATATGPLITTITDLIATSTYLILATLILA
ncbi:MAG: magnesium transporter [Omnitrophica WOR_2 bacterium RIFCSPHIGHO2_02_FULL_68_15]|nr:MAG: magnesium transporter [Omnitrophica WOR_2 bacterium RIFCSPHIGHO2_02_FULL_68_15]